MLREDKADQSPVTVGHLVQGGRQAEQHTRESPPGRDQHVAEEENTAARRPVAGETASGRQPWSREGQEAAGKDGRGCQESLCVSVSAQPA